MKLFDLTGRVAVVSGAAQGMGQATALAVAEAGADVVLVDRNLAGAERTAPKSLRWAAVCLLPQPMFPIPTPSPALFRQVDDTFGRVDFLGNIAGDGLLATPEDLTIAELQHVFDRIWWSAGLRCASKPAGGCWTKGAVRS